MLAVGAPKHSDDAGNKGAAYIYQQRSQQDPFQFDFVTALHDDNTDDNFFGSSVGVSGTMLLVGAPLYKKDNTGDAAGVVFHFKYNGAAWQQIGKLFATGVVFSGHPPSIITDPC